ncbi:MAG: PilW family protein [Gammaproteobacteria bacterium]|nr:PilW family protein [Gammaproteobacteria bacterium]
MQNLTLQTVKKQKGISLVEIMVAMVISLFLLGGVIQVYMGNRTAYRFSDATSRIQENARFALETMASDIRMTGFWGCAQFTSPQDTHLVNNLNIAANDPLYDFIQNDVISATVNDGLNGSDSLTVSGSKAGQNIILAPFMVNTDDDIEVDSVTSLQTNDIAIISNCEGADIFEITGVVASATAGQSVIQHSTVVQASTPGNINPPDCSAGGSRQCFSQIYESDAAIAALQTITYSIQAGASGEPALWRAENGVNDELIEGIEQMQILFGVDSDGDGSPNQYMASSAVADLSQVSAVRIFLVVRSDEDGITDDAQVYSVNGTSFTATDNRLRRVFSVTVTMRNKAGLIL